MLHQEGSAHKRALLYEYPKSIRGGAKPRDKTDRLPKLNREIPAPRAWSEFGPGTFVFRGAIGKLVFRKHKGQTKKPWSQLQAGPVSSVLLGSGIACRNHVRQDGHGDRSGE